MAPTFASAAAAPPPSDASPAAADERAGSSTAGTPLRAGAAGHLESSGSAASRTAPGSPSGSNRSAAHHAGGAGGPGPALVPGGLYAVLHAFAGKTAGELVTLARGAVVRVLPASVAPTTVHGEGLAHRRGWVPVQVLASGAVGYAPASFLAALDAPSLLASGRLGYEGAVAAALATLPSASGESGSGGGRRLLSPSRTRGSGGGRPLVSPTLRSLELMYAPCVAEVQAEAGRHVAVVVESWTAGGPGELSVAVGEHVLVLPEQAEHAPPGWVYAFQRRPEAGGSDGGWDGGGPGASRAYGYASPATADLAASLGGAWGQPLPLSGTARLAAGRVTMRSPRSSSRSGGGGGGGSSLVSPLTLRRGGSALGGGYASSAGYVPAAVLQPLLPGAEPLLTMGVGTEPGDGAEDGDAEGEVAGAVTRLGADGTSGRSGGMGAEVPSSPHGGGASRSLILDQADMTLAAVEEGEEGRAAAAHAASAPAQPAASPSPAASPHAASPSAYSPAAERSLSETARVLGASLSRLPTVGDASALGTMRTRLNYRFTSREEASQFEHTARMSGRLSPGGGYAALLQPVPFDGAVAAAEAVLRQQDRETLLLQLRRLDAVEVATAAQLQRMTASGRLHF